MASTTTTKPVNLYQLGQEIGGNPGFRMVADGSERTVSTDDCTQQALDTAVAAHTANPAIVAPPTPAEVAAATAAANEATIRSQIDTALATLTTTIDAQQATFTTVAQAQTVVRALQNQVKDNARIMRKVLRLVGNRLDGTD